MAAVFCFEEKLIKDILACVMAPSDNLKKKLRRQCRI
jgi:hypothetical protein